MAGEQLALAKHPHILKAHKDHRLLPQRAVLELAREQDTAEGRPVEITEDMSMKGRVACPSCNLGPARSLSQAPSGWHEEGRCCPMPCAASH